MKYRMTTLLVVSISLFLFVPAIAKGEGDPIVGTRSDWIVDVDMDGKADGSVTVEVVKAVSSLDSDSLFIDGFRCTITFLNHTTGANVTMENSTMEWMGISMASINEKEQPLSVEVHLGVNRHVFSVPVTVNGFVMKAIYDNRTGLLLQVCDSNGTVDILGNEIRTSYMRIQSTDVFFNEGMVKIPLLVTGSIFVSIAVIYTVLVMIKDKRSRSKKACFDDDCLP